MSAALLWPVDRIVPLRVGAETETETEGLDLALQDERGYKPWPGVRVAAAISHLHSRAPAASQRAATGGDAALAIVQSTTRGTRRSQAAPKAATTCVALRPAAGSSMVKDRCASS